MLLRDIQCVTEVHIVRGDVGVWRLHTDVCICMHTLAFCHGEIVFTSVLLTVFL